VQREIVKVKRLSISIAVFAFASVSALAGELTGYISDAKCATASAKAKTAAEWIKPAAFENCVKTCVKNGSEVVFVTEDNKVLKIDAASMDKIMPELGHKVRIAGKVEGDTLVKVESVTTLTM
jgi:hypothetical protein